MTLTTVAVLTGPLLLVPLGARVLASAAGGGLLAADTRRGPAAMPTQCGQNPAPGGPAGATRPSGRTNAPRTWDDGRSLRPELGGAGGRSSVVRATDFWPRVLAAHLGVGAPAAARSLAPGLGLGAAAAVGSAVLPTGAVAGVVAAVWMVATGWRFSVESFGWWRDGRQVAGLPTLVAWGWLPVAAGWFAASRAGIAPLGFGEPITLLTAAHFHVAGFGLSVLASTTARRLGARRWARLAWAAWSLATLGPVCVAIGFTVDEPALNMVGAFVVATGVFALCPCIVVAVAGAAPPARWLGRVAAVVPLAPMVLAVVYSLGPVLGTPAPSIELMVRAHGIVNALGFVALGLVALQLVDRPEPQDASPAPGVAAGRRGRRSARPGAEMTEVRRVVVA